MKASEPERTQAAALAEGAVNLEYVCSHGPALSMSSEGDGFATDDCNSSQGMCPTEIACDTGQSGCTADCGDTEADRDNRQPGRTRGRSFEVSLF